MSYNYSDSAPLELGWHNQHQTSQALTLSKTSQHTSDFLESLPPNLASRVRQLLGIQARYSQLMEQYRHEALQLEKKYLSLYTPLYTERREIIDTPYPVAADFGPAVSTLTGLPEFWLTAIRNNSMTSDMITPEDEAALKLLKDVRLEYLDRPGFRILFEFAENDFFENQTLSKTFFYTQHEEDYTGGLVNGHSVGEEIRWREGKNLMRTVVKTKRKRGKVHEEIVPKESFFDFFTSLIESDSGNSEAGDEDAEPSGEQDEEADEDEDDDPEAEFQWLLELDFGYGEALKDDIIPYAVHWFTGEATLFEEEEDDESDDESEDDEDEDEDEEDSEDEDEDEESEEDF